ncbi:MAG: shikimate dehydrogenase [Clostridia bacterium]|nr:shikimate dehydrogenase [Clostridia bacterium]
MIFLGSDNTSRLVGIIGYPLGHSLSPAMHNGAFQHLGLGYHYVAFPVKPEDLAQAIAGLKALNIAGCNVTIPYKEKVIPLLDHLDRDAALLGAVNTIVNRDGELWGYNTDGAGFLRSLREVGKIEVDGRSVLIMGAGGAARAVAFALAKEGAGRLIIANRSRDKGEKLAADIRQHFACPVQTCDLAMPSLREELKSVQLLINTLPLGMFPQTEAMPPVEPEWLKPPITVCDLIYNPPKTKLLAMAEKQGCPVLNGEGMLVYQGAAAFKLWTGYEAPVDIMRSVIRQQLKRQI